MLRTVRQGTNSGFVRIHSQPGREKSPSDPLCLMAGLESDSHGLSRLSINSQPPISNPCACAGTAS